MNIADELQKLEALRSSGALSEDEYARAKSLVLQGNPPDVPAVNWTGESNPLKQFRRSRRDRWLGGICGGLGASTPVPSWAWRVAFCLLLLSFGVGLIPYILLWIFVPDEESELGG
jgi:phage shock protein PspC (stress-responsive transcriptional regulator)